MKEKGQNALEIVFTMFILIVVTLVIIRLFTTTVARESLPNIEDFRGAYNYDKEKTKCNNKCSAFTSDGCSDLSAAVAYCQEKIAIDIDGNFKTNEKGHGGLITGIPYCEDGLYCFHITECGCGSYILNPANCLRVMKDYYQGQIGLSEQTANQIIVEKVTAGTCNPDPSMWGRKFYEGYVPVRLPDNECRDYNLDSPCNLPANWWWWKGGYGKISEQVVAQTAAAVLPTFLFSCFGSDGNVKCTWLGCPTEGEVVILLSDGSFYKDIDKPTGVFTFGPMQPGTYSAVLICGGKTATSGLITIE
jgi:hypothetical protein